MNSTPIKLNQDTVQLDKDQGQFAFVKDVNMLGVTIETIKMTENSVYVNWFNEEKYAQYYKLILISTFSNPTGN